MVILGLILLIIGLIASISILWIIGLILVIVGLVLNFVPVGGNAGTLIMVGGGIVGLMGLWNYLK